MPSRRPPSQRDPAYALHRLPGQVRQILPGVQVKNASPVKQTSAAWKAPTGGGDSDHDGTGTNSTAVGTGATATNDYSTAVGDGASSSADYALAVGPGAAAGAASSVVFGSFAETTSTADNSTVVGYAAVCYASYGISIGRDAQVNVLSYQGIAIGNSASADGQHAIAVGANVVNLDADTCKVGTDELELISSSGAVATSLIVHSPDGSGWRLSVDNAGVLSVAPA